MAYGNSFYRQSMLINPIGGDIDELAEKLDELDDKLSVQFVEYLTSQWYEKNTIIPIDDLELIDGEAFDVDTNETLFLNTHKFVDENKLERIDNLHIICDIDIYENSVIRIELRGSTTTTN